MLRVALAAGLLAGPAGAEEAASAWLRDRIAGMQAVHGRYINGDYGFSVMPPPGAAAYTGNAPNPNHGVIFMRGEERVITARAEYNSDDGITPCAASPAQDSHAAVLRSTGRLGNRPACVVAFTGGGSFEQVMEQQAAGILYTVSLTTTAGAKTTDLAAFQRVVTSFRHIRIVP